MKISSLFKTFAGALLLALSSMSNAGVILAVDSVVENTMGEHPCCGSALADMFNQEGLSSNYTSGVTDFDTFVTSGVTHSGGDSTSWLSSPSVFSGYLILDLGDNYTVSDFVMWNGASGITASVNGFTLTTSMTSDFAVSSVVGLFNGQQSNFGATVYDMIDTVARYVRFDISGNFGNGCCIAIGDIAFNVSEAIVRPPSIPEPAGLALLGTGLVLFRLARKQK